MKRAEATKQLVLADAACGHTLVTLARKIRHSLCCTRQHSTSGLHPVAQLLLKLAICIARRASVVRERLSAIPPEFHSV